MTMRVMSVFELHTYVLPLIYVSRIPSMWVVGISILPDIVINGDDGIPSPNGYILPELIIFVIICRLVDTVG